MSLGKKTQALGKATQEYNFDSSWSKVKEEPPQTASTEKRPAVKN